MAFERLFDEFEILRSWILAFAFLDIGENTYTNTGQLGEFLQGEAGQAPACAYLFMCDEHGACSARGWQ